MICTVVRDSLSGNMADIEYGAFLNSRLSTRVETCCAKSLARISAVKFCPDGCSSSGSTIEPIDASNSCIFLSPHLSRRSSRIIFKPCLSGSARLELMLMGISTSSNCTFSSSNFVQSISSLISSLVFCGRDITVTLLASFSVANLPTPLFPTTVRPPLVVVSRSLKFVPTTIHLFTISS